MTTFCDYNVSFGMPWINFLIISGLILVHSLYNALIIIVLIVFFSYVRPHCFLSELSQKGFVGISPVQLYHYLPKILLLLLPWDHCLVERRVPSLIPYFVLNQTNFFVEFQCIWPEKWKKISIRTFPCALAANAHNIVEVHEHVCSLLRRCLLDVGMSLGHFSIRIAFVCTRSDRKEWRRWFLRISFLDSNLMETILRDEKHWSISHFRADLKFPRYAGVDTR